MPQYHKPDVAEFINKPNEYWKLSSRHMLTGPEIWEILEEREYRTGSVADKRELRQALIRSDRGLLSYKQFSNDEMRKLIKARGIHTYFGKGSIGQRLELVNLLVRADEEFASRGSWSCPPSCATASTRCISTT